MSPPGSYVSERKNQTLNPGGARRRHASALQDKPPAPYIVVADLPPMTTGGRKGRPYADRSQIPTVGADIIRPQTWR